MKLKPKLKNCPFCGNSPRFNSNGIGDVYVICDFEENSCGVITSGNNCETYEKAEKRWNKRK